jgi:hypothetical protein
MDRAYWTKKLREADAELDAARGKTATDAAARKLMRIRAELKALGPAPAKKPKRQPSRGARSADAAS